MENMITAVIYYIYSHPDTVALSAYLADDFVNRARLRSMCCGFKVIYLVVQLVIEA